MPPKAKKTTEKQRKAAHANRQRQYHQRMREAGFSRLSVWVPTSRKDEFDAEIARLQRRWEKANLYPSDEQS